MMKKVFVLTSVVLWQICDFGESRFRLTDQSVATTRAGTIAVEFVVLWFISVSV